MDARSLGRIALLGACLLPRARAQAPGPGAGLSFARCALGTAADCLAVLKCGLPPEDRPSVRLAPSGAVVVETEHVSSSANFAALKKVAGAPDRTRISVLAPSDRFLMRAHTEYPQKELQTVSVPMGHPDTSDGFLGYTFFPYLGREEAGILYSAGDWSEAVVNAKQSRAGLAGTIAHELRHVLAGDFGRAAPLAVHGRPEIERATREANDEAQRNAARCP